MKTFEIYFSDLTDKAKKELMDLVGISDPKEMNWDLDVVPIAIVDFEDEEDEEYRCKRCPCYIEDAGDGYPSCEPIYCASDRDYSVKDNLYKIPDDCRMREWANEWIAEKENDYD